MGLSSDVTLRRLVLGTKDSTTGWYAKSFTESTIEAIIIRRGAENILTGTGLYVRGNYLGVSVDPVLEGDEIYDDGGNYYEVKGVLEHWYLDSFLYYSYDLVKLPLHAERPATSGTWPTVDDASSRTKVYLDTYLQGGNLRDDDGAALAFIVSMSDPDYPLQRVFDVKGVELVYSIGHSRSTPSNVNWDGTIVGYNEKIPVTIFTIDKDDLTGRRVVWSAEAELRRVLEDNPLGSYRSLQSSRPTTVSLGSTILYSMETTLSYGRDTT